MTNVLEQILIWYFHILMAHYVLISTYYIKSRQAHNGAGGGGGVKQTHPTMLNRIIEKAYIFMFYCCNI